MSRQKPAPEETPWCFLSRYAQVLLCIAEDPSRRMRDIAEVLDITERSVQKIITRLESSGILERSREGRANRYHLHLDKNLPHLREEPYPLRALCDLILNR